MSFFKRAFSAAMTRREELRDANIEEFEEDVDRGLKLLEQASENKKQSDAIIKNRKKIVRPLQIAAQSELGFTPSVPATLYAFSLGKTPEKTNQILKGLSKTTASAKEMAEEMPSTTEPLTTTQQMSQAFADSTEQEIRQKGKTPETIGSRAASTILGTFLGRAPKRSVSETVRQKYVNSFENPEQGQKIYDELMNYRKQRIDEGDPAELPDLDPVEMKLLQNEERKLVREERVAESVPFVRSGLQVELTNRLKGLGVSKIPPAFFSKDGIKTISPSDLYAQNDIKNEEKRRQIKNVISDFYEYSSAIKDKVNSMYRNENYTYTGRAAYEEAADRIRKEFLDSNRANIFTGTSRRDVITEKVGSSGQKQKVELTGGRLITKQAFMESMPEKDFKEFKSKYALGRKAQSFDTDNGRVVVQYDASEAGGDGAFTFTLYPN